MNLDLPPAQRRTIDAMQKAPHLRLVPVGRGWGISGTDTRLCMRSTVDCLERQGLIERTELYPEVWRDPRRLTDAGRQA